MILKGFEELKRFLESSKNIVIVGHRNPDGDAMGSTLALKHYLGKKGHDCTVVVPNDYPDFLKWMPKQDKIVIFESDKIAHEVLTAHKERRSVTGSLKTTPPVFDKIL